MLFLTLPMSLTTTATATSIDNFAVELGKTKAGQFLQASFLVDQPVAIIETSTNLPGKTNDQVVIDDTKAYLGNFEYTSDGSAYAFSGSTNLDSLPYFGKIDKAIKTKPFDDDSVHTAFGHSSKPKSAWYGTGDDDSAKMLVVDGKPISDFGFDDNDLVAGTAESDTTIVLLDNNTLAGWYMKGEELIPKSTLQLEGTLIQMSRTKGGRFFVQTAKGEFELAIVDGNLVLKGAHGVQASRLVGILAGSVDTAIQVDEAPGDKGTTTARIRYTPVATMATRQATYFQDGAPPAK